MTLKEEVMRKGKKSDMIVLPSADGAEYDLYVLPPTSKPFPKIRDAVDFVTATIMETKEALGEDEDGNAGREMLNILRKRGFTVLEAHFAESNWDA